MKTVTMRRVSQASSMTFSEAPAMSTPSQTVAKLRSSYTADAEFMVVNYRELTKPHMTGKCYCPRRFHVAATTV